MQSPQGAIPLEVVAAITAALSAALDQPVGSFVVKSIERASPPSALAPTSVWAKSGVLEAHLARRGFGQRFR